jgi:uncharacterized repeat protein (TIGR03803 family)
LGIAALLAGAAIPACANAANTSKVLYTFTGGNDGFGPNQVITDALGNIYGTTEYGGAGTCPYSLGGACGTVFKITPAGQLTVLATFNGPNGGVPYGPVTLAGNVLYGATTQGGSTNNGVIFSVDTDGSNFQVLHQFSNRDGSYPLGTILVGLAGIYGVTNYGGPFGAGELYKLNKGGTVVILHAFKKRDGANPADIRFGPDGVIEGTTYRGGTAACPLKPGCGVVFSYTPGSRIFADLYQFTGHRDGSGPEIGSIDNEGDIFGVTGSGPANTTGTLFELSPGPNGATLTTLADLTDATGSNPGGGPALLPTGQLLGGSFESVYLYDPMVAHDGALLVDLTSSPEFGGPAAIGPSRTAFINAIEGGAALAGQIWSIAPAPP